jgi:hypothetical protein
MQVFIKDDATIFVEIVIRIFLIIKVQPKFMNLIKNIKKNFDDVDRYYQFYDVFCHDVLYKNTKIDISMGTVNSSIIATMIIVTEAIEKVNKVFLGKYCVYLRMKFVFNEK